MRRLFCGMLAAFLIAGCGSSNDSGTVAQPNSSVPAEQTPAVAKPEKLVIVHESEFKLDPANANGGDQGIVKIKVVNDGKVTHSLAVDGPEGRVDLDGDVPPGKTATFEVDLDKPGTYTWFCPLDHHRANGMTGTITVGGSAPARGSGTQQTTVTSTTRTTPTQTQTTTQTQTRTQTRTQTQTQTQTQTVTTPSKTGTSTSPTATTGSGSGNGY